MAVDISPEILQAKQRFGIIGDSPALLSAVERAIQVAPIDLSVLINGESGAGKEFFPKIIHGYSARKHAKYIAVNCGAIPEGTIDSELFGHEKGAFTGAISSRKGYFEEADGGTIFLDEVAELPLTTQARLLRVLESGEFIRVGSSEVKKTNIRVVAATNVDMMKAIREGKFREDLYYRLSTVFIAVPPLRDRGNDILLLTRKFSKDFAETYRMPKVEFEDSAKDRLKSFRWPGNVRQLKNIIEQISLFEAGKTVGVEQLKNYIPDSGMDYTPAVAQEPVSHSYEKERELIFKMIVEMKKELTSLREYVENGGQKPKENEVFSDSEGVYNDVNCYSMKTPSILPVRYEKKSFIESNPAIAHDVNHPNVEEERMSLEDTEKEVIRRSLERNGGKRKKTADELRISERTLYRKIKEYGLE